MNGEISFEGTINNVIFNNPENGYTVFSVLPSNPENFDNDEIVCIAFMEEAVEGEFIELCGSYVVHPSYGRQFNISKYEKKIPNTSAGIEKYLASGVIKGIGERLAAKIVAMFGDETLHIMEEYPEKLAGIKGINLTKALAIGELFKEQSGQRNAIMSLQSLGISAACAMKIYKKFKDDSFVIVKTNPYVLADEIFGIGFKTADEIAYKAGFTKDDPLRITAGLKYVLMQSTNDGHVCLPRERFIERACEILEAGRERVENALITLQMDRAVCAEKICDDEIMVYLNSYYYAESYVAKKLIELSVCSGNNKLDVPHELAKIEAETGVVLAAEQRRAVEEALSSGVLVITGGPGTGKTTIINTIIRLLDRDEYLIELAAPTGRAAKRMTETTGRDAKTIHRLLGVSFSDESGKRQSFEKNEDNPIEADILILDESSMIDIMLMYNLMKAISAGTKLIFVGDADQLPSVGPGNVLRDMISSGIINTVKLNEIFRRDQGSAISINAHSINHGEYPVFEGASDFFLVKRTNADDVAATIIDLIKNRLPDHYKIDSKKDIQLLSPMRKGQLGITSLNTALQQALNPPSSHKNEKIRLSTIFRERDKVIQIKNNYNIEWKIFNKSGGLKEDGMGVFNGDEGIITQISDSREKLTVIFDDARQVEYDYSLIDELELSYAITVHKSQGSEYNTVILPVHSGPYMLMNRNILYTAVTRAKKLVVLVGTEDALRRMIDNNREIERYSTLAHRMNKIYSALT